MNTLTLELTGGLGNQLFSYAYATKLATKFDLNLVLDGSVTERVLGRPADLFEFALDHEGRTSLKDISAFNVNMNRALWKYQATRRITNRNLSSILSWDHEYQKFAKGGKLRGFFQGKEAYKVINELNPDRFELQKPSENYITLAKEILSKHVTAIHMRRGDYKNYKDNFGLLSPRYYQSVVRDLHFLSKDSEIWLFSDEPDQSKAELTKSGIEIRKVVSPLEISSSETLKLMSFSKRLITANSTFSWWAGALGQEIEVVTPQPWFRRQDDWLNEKELVPNHWIRFPAEWVENG